MVIVMYLLLQRLKSSGQFRGRELLLLCAQNLHILHDGRDGHGRVRLDGLLLVLLLVLHGFLGQLNVQVGLFFSPILLWVWERTACTLGLFLFLEAAASLCKGREGVEVREDEDAVNQLGEGPLVRAVVGSCEFLK
jgi:hypothetical protein